VLTYEQKFEPV